jgi:DNA-3-methyladenine glycosylase I
MRVGPGRDRRRRTGEWRRGGTVDELGGATGQRGRDGTDGARPMSDAGAGPMSDAGPGPASDAGPGPASDSGAGPASEAGSGAGPAPGPDGLARCPWALSSPDYLPYHDEEWGRPVRDDAGIFERLSLEAFQSGLSWLTILRKRDNFRAAFAGFDPAAVAAFGAGDTERLLADAGIVRNRAKIEAVIGNARATLSVPGGLAALMWSYAGEPGRPPATMADIPPWTPASKACAKELRRLGFTFTGPVTVYAALQACGVVDDHLAGCFRRSAYS